MGVHSIHTKSKNTINNKCAYSQESGPEINPISLFFYIRRSIIILFDCDLHFLDKGCFLMNEDSSVLYINVYAGNRARFLARGEAVTKTISFRINRELLEAVRGKLDELRERGVKLSLNALLHHLLIAFLDANIQYNEDNTISINIDKIEIENRYNRKRNDAMHVQMHVQMHSTRKATPGPPKELIGKANNILRRRLQLPKEEYLRLLEDVLQELLGYKEDPLARYYIDIIRWELEH